MFWRMARFENFIIHIPKVKFGEKNRSFKITSSVSNWEITFSVQKQEKVKILLHGEIGWLFCFMVYQPFWVILHQIYFDKSSNNSVLCKYRFLFTLLSLKTVLLQTIQFSISIQFNSFWSIDRTLSGAITLGKSGPGSDGNKGVLCIPQSSSITGTSLSDCLVS